MGFKDQALERVDLTQQRIRPLAFVMGVLLRYRDDRGGRWAALIGYFGFFSIFPLLLSFVTVIGIVLENRPKARDDILDSALGQFPVIGNQLSVESLSGSPVVVALGVLTALWAGLKVVQTFQDALNLMWSVPPGDRPNFVMKRLRSLAMLVVIAAGVVASSAVTAVGTFGGGVEGLNAVLTQLGSVLINIALVVVAYKILTKVTLTMRDVLPGAIFAGAALYGLSVAGVYFITRVSDSSDTYGVFATVIGLLTWLTLQAQAVILGFEINVVRVKGFWPRSIREDHPTAADRAAFEDIARREIALSGVKVHIEIDDA